MPDRQAGDLEGQLYRAVRERILTGRLASGERLASTRSLAAALSLSRSTVVGAYDRLKAEGYLVAAGGSATRVGVVSPPLGTDRSEPAGKTAPDIPAPPLRFRPGIPELASFPHREWARCLAARARSFRHYDLGYDQGQGLLELRRAILDHVGQTRGVSAAPEQVFIVPSTRVALGLIARIVIDTARPDGNRVWIEDPGYWAAQATFRAAGGHLVPVPCDGQGIDIRAMSAPAPSVIYTTPSHQYPTGATMSLQRRLDLLDFAQEVGAIVIEDDYDSEYHYGTRPIAALAGIDRSGVVAYLGTFSKVLAPGLRVAYMVLPRRMLAPMADACLLLGATVSLHVQAALADFIREGRLRAHIRKMSQLYAARMAAAVAALRTHCGAWLEPGTGNDGLQLASWFRDAGTDDRLVARRLAALGYGMQPMSRFFLRPAVPGLLFGIADVDPARMEAEARALGLALRRFA